MPLKTLRLLAPLLLLAPLWGQDFLFSRSDGVPPVSRQDLMEIQQQARDVAARAQAATVGLSLRNAMGSGVVISEDGYVLTAAHVVGSPGEEVTVQFPDGRTAEAISLGMHTTVDGALVKIKGEGKWPYMPMIEQDQAPEVGDWCVAMGHPQGFREERSPPVRLGRVIEFTSEVIRSDCTITGGDSGGPLFDLEGRVMGIHSRISERNTENFHVPVIALLDGWDRLVEGKLYPDPIPSQFLAILDVDGDGQLTRSELTSRYQRAVFDRLIVNFDLDRDEPLDVTKIAENAFQWEEKIQPGLKPLGEELSLSQPLPARMFVRGPEVREQFEAQVQQASEVTVRVMVDGIPVALGVVVRGDGLVLTKSSSLKPGEVTCLLPDGEEANAEVVSQDVSFDLALLKVSAPPMTPVVWSESVPDPGAWVAVVDTLGRAGSLGVVAVSPRNIPKVRPVIGVSMPGEGTTISYVAPKGGADVAGLNVGDVIVSMEGQSVRSIDEIHQLLDDYRAGDKVATVVDRDGESIEVEIMLGMREDVFLGMGGGHWEMSGPLSRRRDGFPIAIQLDAVIHPTMCGGPMVDAEGNVIGVTLARADRVSTLGVTFSNLRDTLERLISQGRVPYQAPVATQQND